MPEEGEVHPVGLMVTVGTIILARWLVIAGIRAWFGHRFNIRWIPNDNIEALF